MGFKLEISKNQECVYHGNLIEYRRDDRTYLYESLTEEVIREFSDAYSKGEHSDFLNRVNLPYFIIIVIDKNAATTEIFNDHFGSREIYFTKLGNGFAISDAIRDLLRPEELQVDKAAVYEMVVFQGILPPDTIFLNVMCVPSGTSVVFSDGSYTFHSYWDLNSWLTDKESNYERQIDDGRAALLGQMQGLDKNTIGVALSGGVDSGGLLGMMRSVHGDGIKSISVGGRGEDTFDLKSARASAEFNKSDHHELYPTYHDLSKLWRYYKDLNQPVSASTIFVYSLIHDRARELGLTGLVYGFGAEMLLGNLRVARIADRLWFEQLIPRSLLKPLYRFIVKIKGLNRTHLEFLNAESWVDRFMYVRGAHFTWEREYFKKSPDEIWSGVRKKMSHYEEDIEVTDKLLILYLKSWVNYLQARDITSFGRSLGVYPVIPFDSMEVARVFMRTKLRDRKRNNWNKQLIRDIMRPFVSDHLYSNPVRSLIVPYNELFDRKTDEVINYLSSSKLVGELFDYEKIRKEYSHMPEGGLFLFHIFGIAVWYDVLFQNDRHTEFLSLFE